MRYATPQRGCLTDIHSSFATEMKLTVVVVVVAVVAVVAAATVLEIARVRKL